ncbi:type III secretion system translocon subunit SctE [Pseudomonas tructae]|nr:type III secretion system translocon subunit SctE [Pseudomonas tructae]
MDISALFKAAREPIPEPSADYRAAAGIAAQTLEFRHIATQALAAVQYTGSTQAIAGRPQLAAPRSHVDSQATFIELMASVNALLGEVGNHKLKLQLSMLQDRNGARQKALEQLSAEFAAAVQALEQAQGQAEQGQGQLEQLAAQLEQTRQLLRQSEERLAGLSPESAEYQQELEVLNGLRGQVQTQQQAMNTAVERQRQLVAQVEQLGARAIELEAQVAESSFGGSAGKQPNTPLDSLIARALLLRLQVIELLGEAAEEKELANRELYQTIQAAQQEKLEEEARKAERGNALGCIFKWVGVAIAAAVLVVATAGAGAAVAGGGVVAAGAGTAAAGGGAAAGTAAGTAAGAAATSAVSAKVVVAAVGLGLTLTDMLVEKATGNSFMAKAMEPLMEVMQFMMKVFTELYAAQLKALGFGDQARKVAEVAAMIATVVATTVAVALAASAAGSLASSIASKVGAKLGAMLPQAASNGVQALRQAASSASASLGQSMRTAVGVGTDSVSLARFSTRVEMALEGIQLGGSLVESGLQVGIGVQQKQIAEHQAEAHLAQAQVELIVQYLGEVTERYGEALKQRTTEVERLFNDLQRQADVGRFISQRI